MHSEIYYSVQNNLKCPTHQPDNRTAAPPAACLHPPLSRWPFPFLLSFPWHMLDTGSSTLPLNFVDPNILDDSTEIITLQHPFHWKAPTALTGSSSFQNLFYCLFVCYHHLHLIHVLFSPQCSIPFFQLWNISSVPPYTLPSASSHQYIIISLAPLFKQILQITSRNIYRGDKEILNEHDEPMQWHGVHSCGGHNVRSNLLAHLHMPMHEP